MKGPRESIKEPRETLIAVDRYVELVTRKFMDNSERSDM